MRVLYLDEAGIGKMESDPIMVVAGVLIHADSQWMALANRLEEILRDATPLGAAVPSHLHAKDIFHGSREFDRRTWSDTIRFGLLAKIAALPVEFDVPVVWAHIDRKEWAQDRKATGDSPAELLTDAYTICAVTCLMKTEVYMRTQENRTEVASVVLEQNGSIQQRVPEMVQFMRNPGPETDNLMPGWERTIPLRHIIDAPAAQPKSASSILQLADYCAFALKRRLQSAAKSDKLVAPFAQQLLTFRDADAVNKNAMWNPKFMPHMYGRHIEFRDGEFHLVSR